MQDIIKIDDVKEAFSLINKFLIKTPLVYSPEFSEITGNKIYFKLENFQLTHAFKIRGALNKIFNLNKAQKEKGVIAASSGNHALGVAYISKLLGVEANVVMPMKAPSTKI